MSDEAIKPVAAVSAEPHPGSVPPLKQPIKKLFKARMDREGKLEKFKERVTAHSKATGKAYAAAIWEVMREFGYLGAKIEYQLHKKYERELYLTTDQQQASIIKRKESEAASLKSFESAVATLPSNAPLKMEMDWISAHPAMCRKNRSVRKADVIVITASDVLMPPHGPAPSKAAVYMLQNWANSPQEFYKFLLAGAKKKGEIGGDSPKDDGDDGTDDIDAMLNSISRD